MHAGFLAALAESQRGILAARPSPGQALVGMVITSRGQRWLRAMLGHPEPAGSQNAGHRPANHPAAPEIHDDCQIEEARRGWDIEPAPAKAGVISATHNWFGPAA